MPPALGGPLVEVAAVDDSAPGAPVVYLPEPGGFRDRVEITIRSSRQSVRGDCEPASEPFDRAPAIRYEAVFELYPPFSLR